MRYHCGKLWLGKAEALGDAAYETRIIALTMAASDAANMGRLDEAERYFDAVLRESEAHADLLHLGGAYSNRSLLWFARKDAVRVFEDLARATKPRYMRLEARFNVRGGIYTTVIAEHRKKGWRGEMPAK